MAEITQLQPEPGWGRTTEHTRVGRLSLGEAGHAIDRLDIAERVYRYGWGFDERDPELLGDCFIDDAIWEGNIMGQISVGPFAGREKIVEWLATFWDDQQDQRRHIFTNLITQDVTQDTATAHAYLLLTATGEAKTTPVTNGPYRFELARQDDSWRIVHLFAGFDAPF